MIPLGQSVVLAYHSTLVGGYTEIKDTYKMGARLHTSLM